MEPTPRATEIAPSLLAALSMVLNTRGQQKPFDPFCARRLFTIHTRDASEAICLPVLYEAIVDEAPAISIETVYHRISDIADEMASGKIDFALGHLPSLDAGVHRRLLFSHKYVCVVRPGHPLTLGNLNAERLGECDHLLVRFSGSGQPLLEKAFEAARLLDRIKIRIPQYLAAPHLVLKSDLVWSAPANLAKELAKYYGLVVLPHPLPLDSVEVSLYWHERYHRDSANKWMRELIVRRLAKRN